ncbi:hypothetical protein FBZ84_101142 [Azospirillum baldaniorum]|nr:hypothetical protein FBZ84_101142 [Azospirillum baldaniorum]
MIPGMDYRTQLLTLAEAYARSTGLSEARIATLVRNQGVFFKRIRAGGGCSVDTYLDVKDWFAGHWPTDLPWPEGVDRPDILPRQTPAARHLRRKQPHEARA